MSNRERSRTSERLSFDHPTRIALLESDMDTLELALSTQNRMLFKILWMVVGVFISTSTGAVLFAANLLVK